MSVYYDEENAPRVLDTGSLATQPIANLAIPLDIPTPDWTPALGAIYKSVNHPDVVLIPEGLHGYRYWMAYMPYPDNLRETACICASNNGVDWEVPAGMTNPVETQQQLATATGWTYIPGVTPWHGDVDLVLHANGDLALYTTCFNSAVDWQLTRHTLNADGRSWSARAVVLSGVAAGVILSPALVVESDGSVTMFYRTGATNPGSIRYRTSTDHGVTWSSESAAVTLQKTFFLAFGDAAGNENPTPWHLDVARVAEKYHLLALAGTGLVLNSDNSVREGSLLYYWTGHVNDKLNSWKLESYDRAIWPSGYDVDGLQYYRSCLVPVPGELDRFDVYLACQPRGVASQGDFPISSVTLNAGTDFFTFALTHFYNNNDLVTLVGAVAPAGGAGFGDYWVVNRTSLTFQLSTTMGGSSVNWTTTGTNLSISRNPWRIALLKNVKLPMEPKTVNAQVVPPASTIPVAAAATWFAADYGIFNRFTLTKTTRMRYVRFHVAVQSGDIEVGVGKLVRVERDFYYPLVDSGEFACPAAGAAKVDLGAFTLPPGDYAVYLKADNIIFQTFFGQSATWLTSSKMTGVVAGGWPGAMFKEGLPFDPPSGHRWVAGLVLEGDYP